MTRTCARCNSALPLSEFHLRKRDGKSRSHECKSCSRVRIRNYYRAHPGCQSKKSAGVRARATKAAFIESVKKRSVCAECGEQRWYLLQFHHTDPTVKEFNISQSARWPLRKVKNEIDKCSVLCANCHIAFHYRERETKKQAKCAQARSKVARTSRRPSEQTLRSLAETHPAQAVARIYGVSGPCVRKWLLSYGITPRPRGYWTKLYAVARTASS